MALYWNKAKQVPGQRRNGGDFGVRRLTHPTENIILFARKDLRGEKKQGNRFGNIGRGRGKKKMSEGAEDGGIKEGKGAKHIETQGRDGRKMERYRRTLASKEG